MKKKIRTLVVEDSEDDALLILHQIKKAGYEVAYERVETSREMEVALEKEKWDIVLSDYAMPHFNGLEALSLLKEAGIDIPFIVISGTIGEETAVKAMRAGANDYLMKGKLKRLVPAIERELREADSRAERTLLEQKQKQAEEKLKILSLAVEQSPASIVITDTDGKIDYVNSKFIAVTGYEYHEAHGKDLNFLRSNEVSTDYFDEMWHAVTSGKEWIGELYNKTKNGRRFWELASISPIIDEAGNITHFLAVKEDITKIKETEKELIEAKEKAEESNRLKTEFLHNMSHEIRTPINGIMGFSVLLRDMDLSKEKQKRHIEFIIDCSNQLLRIISDILEISQLETKQVKARQEKVCLNELLVSLFPIFELKAKEKNIAFSFEKSLSDRESTMISDPVKINKIVSNLLENAVKFTQSGSVEIGYNLRSSLVEIYVKDTGIGINPEKQKAIFDRFSQEDEGLSRLYGGLGLGLAIARENAELLGGKVRLESEKGKGATFYLTIPYVPFHSSQVIEGLNHDL
ncbi:MAG TPA: ATP-binding protein [Sunxiuqinia sp.]|nr:ATP-binding protein [Sunxiuqinia sp.]